MERYLLGRLPRCWKKSFRSIADESQIRFIICALQRAALKRQLQRSAFSNHCASAHGSLFPAVRFFIILLIVFVVLWTFISSI